MSRGIARPGPSLNGRRSMLAPRSKSLLRRRGRRAGGPRGGRAQRERTQASNARVRARQDPPGRRRCPPAHNPPLSPGPCSRRSKHFARWASIVEIHRDPSRWRPWPAKVVMIMAAERARCQPRHIRPAVAGETVPVEQRGSGGLRDRPGCCCWAAEARGV